MESLKLTALRDFAIQHLTRAQHVQKQKHASQDAYHFVLYGTSTLALGSATVSAIEQEAAELLQLVMRLSINWDEGNRFTAGERQSVGHETIAAATRLCILTDTSLPWLADAMTQEPPVSEPEPEQQPKPATHIPSRLPAPQPGIILTTAEAAHYLNVKVQTLHKWASQDSGPLRPVRNGTSRLGWPSDEVIRVMLGK